VKWTDVRLMRRMARDMTHRNVTPFQTLDHWHYVRRSEKKHILPYLSDADFVLNGSFPYEIPLYAGLLKGHFADYLARQGNPEDGRERAERIHALLEQTLPMPDRPTIPQESVVREFIGGGTR
jgi:uridine kinase